MTDLDLNVKAEGVEESVSKLGKLKGALSGLAKAVNPVNKVLGKLGDSTGLAKVKAQMKSTGDEASSTDRKTSKLGRTFSALGKTAGLSVKVTKGMFSKLGQGIGAATTKMGGLVRALGRIAMYRAIRMIFSEMTQMFREGVKNLYDWSSAIDGTFAKSMNSLSTSMNYMKNSLGAMASPLINALAPAFDALADKIVGLMNLVQQFFATITGATTWTKATKQATSYGDAADSATKSTKEFKKQLMGFDEINNITKQADSSSGSGSGSSSGGGAVFTTEKVSSGVTDFVKGLKDAWDKGDFTKYGAAFADTINGLVKTINDGWPTFDSGCKKFAKSLGTFINGFTSTIDMKEIATTVSNVVKTFTETISTLVATINWTQIGQNIGTFILGIDWWGIIVDVFTLITNLITAGVGLVAGLVQAIADKVKTTEWGEVAENMKEGIKKVWDNIKGNIFDLKKEWKDAWQKLKDSWDKDKDKDSKKLPVGIRIFSKVADLWKKFKEKWGEKRKANMGIKNVTKATSLWSVFRASWGSKKLKVGLSKAKDAIKNLWADIKKAWGERKLKITSSTSGLSLGFHAAGGFAPTGEIFVAREAGPEMVGTIGGHTAIANNDQIVEAISRGVYSAMRSAGGSNVNVVLQGDAKGVFKLVQGEAKSYRQRTGSPAFAR